VSASSSCTSLELCILTCMFLHFFVHCSDEMSTGTGQCKFTLHFLVFLSCDLCFRNFVVVLILVTCLYFLFHLACLVFHLALFVWSNLIFLLCLLELNVFGIGGALLPGVTLFSAAM
jgi:hypothetical protein